MKTCWENLYKQSLRKKIKELSILQKEYKSKRAEIFKNKDFYKAQKTEPKSKFNYWRFQNLYDEEMYILKSQIKSNSRLITIYLDMLDQIKNNGKRNHLSTSICYYLDNKHFEFKLNKQYYALCFNIDVFEIYQIDSINLQCLLSNDINSFGLIKKNEIIQISDNKEELEIILKDIQEKIKNENKEIIEIQEKREKARQAYLKECKKLEKAIEKERKKFEDKQKELRAKFQTTIRPLKLENDKLQGEVYEKQDSYKKSLNKIAMEFQNA